MHLSISVYLLFLSQNLVIDMNINRSSNPVESCYYRPTTATSTLYVLS